MDTLSKIARSQLMQKIRSVDTKPEKVVRSLLFKLGYRFRLHSKELPGKPDIALSKYKTVVFIHGCFWHGCTKCDRGLRIPKTNREKWVEKIDQNKRRDIRVQSEIIASGWKVLVIWSCELRDLDALKRRLIEALSQVA
jgi:DNA mismatch endonuclease, patch repair protein